MKTPFAWRVVLAAAVVVASTIALYAGDSLSPPVRSGLGIVTFLLTTMLFSANLKAVNWRVVGAGLFLQVTLAVLILKVPAVYQAFDAAGKAVTKIVGYSMAASGMLFGPNANPEKMEAAFGPKTGVPFLIIVTTTVIFIASLFSVLYHLRVLQAVVWVFAKVMVVLMGKKGVSGAESLSATGNVFMGQTEAPLLVKPYIAKMTRSELLAIMIGGMATVAGGVMAIYISMGADATAILATSVMAAPCGLYVAKILIPETDEPVTRGDVKIADERPHENVIDAASAGASDGMMLAINIVAMLIAFMAMIALIDGLLGMIHPDWSLQKAFAWLFSPVSALMGVDSADVPKVAKLLGEKLVANEFIAFLDMTSTMKPGLKDDAGNEIGISPRSYVLATFALTGFANISSIGIQIGGISAMAKERRGDLAKLGLIALLGGFLATLINASIAGLLT